MGGKKKEETPTKGKSKKDTEANKKGSKDKAQAQPPKTPETKRRKKVDEDEAEIVKWWEKKESHPDGQQWLTLEHNGVYFPPPYQPHGLPVHYRRDDGTLQEIKMEPDEEEVATMFATMRDFNKPPSDFYINPTFRRNFFTEWVQILNKDPEYNLKRFGSRQHPIRLLDRVNFDTIWEWHCREKEKRLNMSKEEKKELKKQREEAVKEYKYCIWDGKKQPVGNFRIEPPGLFRGRGKHPLMGKLKARIQPEDITINIGKEAKVPSPPPGHSWKAVQHDNMVTWLAKWTEHATGGHKYVMLASNSMVKGQSDYKKFEKARNLGELVEDIRKKYREDWKSSNPATQQMAVALYFIDFLALRCGHEKGEDEAETFGACSLKCEHINLDKRDHIVFDFLGKDSIRYFNEVKVDPTVYKLCCEFVKGKTPNSDLFDKIKPTQLNDHLKSLMPGLSAKVFRTFNASQTLDGEFHTNPVKETLSLPEKIAYFNAANTKVALLCNHQRSVSRGFAKAMAQVQDKLDYLKRVEERLKEAKELMSKDKKKGWEEARAKWDAEEDEIQKQWLEKYGTEEEKASYQPRTSSGAPSKSKSSKSKSKSSGSKSETKSETKKESKKKTTPQKEKKKEAKKTAKKKTPEKKEKPAPKPKESEKKAKADTKKKDGKQAKKEEEESKEVKKETKEDSSDSDVPLAELKQKAKKRIHSDSDSDAPLAEMKAKAAKKKK